MYKPFIANEKTGFCSIAGEYVKLVHILPSTHFLPVVTFYTP